TRKSARNGSGQAKRSWGFTSARQGSTKKSLAVLSKFSSFPSLEVYSSLGAGSGTGSTAGFGVSTSFGSATATLSLFTGLAGTSSAGSTLAGLSLTGLSIAGLSTTATSTSVFTGAAAGCPPLSGTTSTC